MINIQKLRDTLYLRAFGLKDIAMIFFVSPVVQEVSDLRCVVSIPLNRRTRNHLRSMYFGALCTGADMAGGLIAAKIIDEHGGGLKKVSLAFKDFRAEFLKRAEGDVHFTCEDGQQIQELVRSTLASTDRKNLTVKVVATVPSKLGDEPVAKFELTLSLKKTG